MKEKILQIISHYGYSSVVAHTPNDAHCVEAPVWLTPESDIDTMLSQGYRFRVNYRDHDGDVESFDLSLYARSERMRQYLGWSKSHMAQMSGYSYQGLRNAFNLMKKTDAEYAVFLLACQVFESMYRMHYFGE